MGTLDLEKETYHRKKIEDALRRRGLLPDMSEDWEIHGPHHPELPYQVYVGYAVYNTAPVEYPCVAIYPRAVFEIDDPADWGKADPEKKIETLKVKGIWQK